MSMADYYDASYPPELWETPAAPVGAARPAAAAETPAATLVVAAGAPGSYVPALRPADRPRNVTELRERARPVFPSAWHPGQYVTVGEKGKRAYWDGETWQQGEAPALVLEAPATVPDGTVERSPDGEEARSEA